MTLQQIDGAYMEWFGVYLDTLDNYRGAVNKLARWHMDWLWSKRNEDG